MGKYLSMSTKKEYAIYLFKQTVELVFDWKDKKQTLPRAANDAKC